MNASFERICKDLKELGLRAGDSVMVHSSLRSMGFVEGGAETVIRALESVLTAEGTLLFPAFTFSTSCVTSEFSVSETPVCIGRIAETFRGTDGVYRSFHPTHSVCAKGKHALDFIRDHGKDTTPMGENSPYRKLPAYNGKILMLGCGLRPNSFLHAVEEVAKAPYALREEQIYKMTDANGVVTYKAIRRHNFTRPEGNLVQRYDRAIEILDEGKDYRVGEIHGARSYLFDAAVLEKKAAAKMAAEPFFFVDDPDGVLRIAK